MDLIKSLKSKILQCVQNPSIVENNCITFFSGKLGTENDMDKILHSDHGFLVGRAFTKDTYEPLTPELLKELTKSDCKYPLIQKCWGKYVSFINDPSGQLSMIITRDPTGQIPFFYCVDKDNNIIFGSEIQIIVGYLPQDPAYNLKYLSSYLIRGASYSNHTLFDNIYELPPGHALIINSSSLTIEETWNPLGYYTRNYNSEDLIAAGKLVLKSWINEYENIFLSLSGGLDSTALLCFLNDIKRPDQNLVAINYYHSKINTSNELKYAAKICTHLNVELREIDFYETLPFDELDYPFLICPNKPLPALINFKQHGMISNHILSEKSSVFISGHGGDHLFMCPIPESSLSDYLFEKGLKGFKHKLEDITSYFRKPVWTILKNNFRATLLSVRNTNTTQPFDNPGWIKGESLESFLSNMHDEVYRLFTKTKLPGKRKQLESIKSAFPTVYLEYIDPSNTTFYPFLYQPIIELILAIPTYDLYKKGYDRYPLRKALSYHYNIDMVWRRDKGQTTGMFQLGFKRNCQNIMRLCSEGFFCKNGLIDKENLFKHIREVSNGSSRALWPLINLISAEIFLSSWDNWLKREYPKPRGIE